MQRTLIFLISLLFFTMGSRSQSNDYVLKDFVIEGNKKTKEWLILRESGYKKGDIIAAEELDAAIEAIRRNVANLQLFLHVTVHPVVLTDNNLLVLIQVAERWYLYPIPYVRLAEPNFNTWLRNSTESRTNYGIKLKQFNFRGRD